MRTTLALDDEVFSYARAQVQREHITLGEAVSRLAREGIRAQFALSAVMGKTSNRFALLPARKEIITADHVRKLMDQEGI
jgi:hypothetical protein